MRKNSYRISTLNASGKCGDTPTGAVGRQVEAETMYGRSLKARIVALFREHNLPVDPVMIRRALRRSMAVALLVCAGCDNDDAGKFVRCHDYCAEHHADAYTVNRHNAGGVCHCTFKLGGAS